MANDTIARTEEEKCKCPTCGGTNTQPFSSAIHPPGPKRECLDCHIWWAL